MRRDRDLVTPVRLRALQNAHALYRLWVPEIHRNIRLHPLTRQRVVLVSELRVHVSVGRLLGPPVTRTLRPALAHPHAALAPVESVSRVETVLATLQISGTHDLVSGNKLLRAPPVLVELQFEHPPPSSVRLRVVDSPNRTRRAPAPRLRLAARGGLQTGGELLLILDRERTALRRNVNWCTTA